MLTDDVGCSGVFRLRFLMLMVYQCLARLIHEPLFFDESILLFKHHIIETVRKPWQAHLPMRALMVMMTSVPKNHLSMLSWQRNT